MPALSFRGRLRGAVGAFGLLCALALSGPSGAAELVMFERSGCAWCQRFDAEVSGVYAKTHEGRLAPLRRVDLGVGVPRDLALQAPVRFAPTFVLMQDGREVGRITGYMSDDAFWGILGTLIHKAALTP